VGPELPVLPEDGSFGTAVVWVVWGAAVVDVVAAAWPAPRRRTAAAASPDPPAKQAAPVARAFPLLLMILAFATDVTPIGPPKRWPIMAWPKPPDEEAMETGTGRR